MTDGLPDNLRPEMLAAYADGELSPRDRACVEHWLAEHPEAREVLETQESLGPRNVEFWQTVRPPEPSRCQWAAALGGIHGRARLPATRRWLPWVGSLALAASAAAVFLAMSAMDAPDLQTPPESPVVVPQPPVGHDDQPFAMASPDEVRIVSLPESAAHLLIVGEHPMRDLLVVLARADEVEFFGVGSDPAGRFPEVPTEAPADDAPMIWAPRDP